MYTKYSDNNLQQNTMLYTEFSRHEAWERDALPRERACVPAGGSALYAEREKKK
jgi:hypothetical protein